MMFPSGNKYIGDYLNSEKNGNGLGIYKSGDIYDGEFKDNKWHGFGKYIFADGTGEYIEYADDKEIKRIRALTAEEMTETKQKVKDHEREIDDIRQ